MKAITIAVLAGMLAVCALASGFKQRQASGSTVAAVAWPPEGPYVQHVLVSYDVTSDLAGSKVYIETNSLTLLATGGTNATFWVASTNSIISGADAVYWSKALNLCYPTTITNLTQATNVWVSTSFSSNIVAGDMLFQMATNVSKPVGAATLREANGAIFVSSGTNTIMLKVDGTSACTVNNAVMEAAP